MECVMVYVETPGYELNDWDVRVACRSAEMVGLSPVLFTNVPEKFAQDGWDVHETSAEYIGWWCLVEMYRYVGPCISCGIDTLFVQKPQGLIDAINSAEPETVFMVSSFHQRFGPLDFRKWGSGLMGRDGDSSFVYDTFQADPLRCMRDRTYTMIPRTGLRAEDDYTADMFLKNGWRIKDTRQVQSGLYSFRRQISEGSEMPEDACVLTMNAQPRLRQAVEMFPWLKKLVNEILS